ncbi:C40 family peptidase [Thermodesulfitimonas autotrophica]|uniref:C40 family peptidase n=1 Tax=Thermodesulfitimonas autotrophica TaxID=1894989 RepID=UPI002FE08635
MVRLMAAALPVVGVHEEPLTGSPLITQALFGDCVVLLAAVQGWCRVISSDGSCGWVRQDELRKVERVRGRRVRVSALQAALETAAGKITLYLGAELTVLGEETDRWRVASADGTRGTISKEAVRPADIVKKGAVGIEIVTTARLFLGVPYLWGGMTVRGIDCSGLTYIAYLGHGYRLARDAEDQYRAGLSVRIEELAPGDLLFFSTTTPGPSHVGIYAGDGTFINARSRSGVCFSSLADPYFRERFLGARRYI